MCSSTQEVRFCGIQVNHEMKPGKNWTVKWAVYSNTLCDLNYIPDQHNCVNANYPRTWWVEYKWNDGTHDIFRANIYNSWRTYEENCGIVGPNWAREVMVNYVEDPVRLPVTMELFSYCGVSYCDSERQFVQDVYVDTSDYMGDWPDSLPPDYADCKHRHIQNIYICDDQYNHLSSASCLAKGDKLYLEAELTDIGDLPGYVLADIYVRPRTGRLGHVRLYYHHGGIPTQAVYRGESDFRIRDLDPDSSGTWVDVDACYVYNCPAGQGHEGYVHTGLPLSDLQLKIENPPSWSQFYCSTPNYIGACIMYKGKLDGCDAYSDNKIEWNFKFQYKRSQGPVLWDVERSDTALTERYTEHYFNLAAKGIDIGGLGIITAKSSLRGVEYNAKPCTVVVIGCPIPDDSITNRLVSTYPPIWDDVFHRTCPTPRLLTGVCYKESTYKQYFQRALFGVTALFPSVPSDQSHVGLMMVPHESANSQWAWNWRENIEQGGETFGWALGRSKEYVRQMKELFVGLANITLQDTAYEDNASLFFETGSLPLVYGTQEYWFLGYSIPEKPDRTLIPNKWIANNKYWATDESYLNKLRLIHKTVQYISTALANVSYVRKKMR